jgi:hypothetical protein
MRQGRRNRPLKFWGSKRDQGIINAGVSKKEGEWLKKR